MILHQHFDEEAPGLPAQAQECGLLKGHVVVSDVHQCCPIILPHKWGDACQTAGAEWTMVRDRQDLEAEAKVRCDACGKGPGTSKGQRMWGHQRLGKSGQEAKVFIFLFCSHLRTSDSKRGSGALGTCCLALDNIKLSTSSVAFPPGDSPPPSSPCSGPPRTRKFPVKWC